MLTAAQILASVVAATAVAYGSAEASDVPMPLALPNISSIDLSPDGRILAGISNAPSTGPLRSRRGNAVTVDTACLFASPHGRPCDTVTELQSARVRFGYWRPNAQAFVLDDAGPLRIDYSAWPATASTIEAPIAGANKVMLVDPATLPAQSGEAILRSEVRYLSSGGATVLRLIDTDDEARVSWPGGELILPRHLYDIGSIMPLRYSLIAKGDGSGFFFWSSSLGRRGQLLEFGKNKRRQIKLPDNLGGPLQLVFPPDGRAAVAAFTPDALQGVIGRKRGQAVRYVERYVRDIKGKDPALELRKVATSDDLETWGLLFSPIDGTAQLHVIRPSSAASRILTLTPSSGERSPARSVSHSTFVEVPRGRASMPARLYSTALPTAKRKLVVTFHGGPPLDTTTTDHPWTAFLARLGFDVLDVDYRGSSGYGEAHLKALKAPAAPILLEDLKTAADWASRQGYAEVGFIGTSAGGLAGVAAASASNLRLDFIILESPLIDWAPGAKVAACARATGQTTDRIFGLQFLSDGGCSPKSTGVFGAKTFAHTPIVILQGGRDLRTPSALAEQWATQARAASACVTIVSAADGGHTLSSWPREDAERARRTIVRWISAIENDACPPAAPLGAD